MYHLELNKTLVYLHTKNNHLKYENIVNKVQYFQNKFGCNKTLLYLHTHTQQTPPKLWQYYKQSKIVPVVQNNYVIAHGVLKTLYLPLYIVSWWDEACDL